MTSSVRFEEGDPVWVLLHGDQRRAHFVSYDGPRRGKIRTRAGLIRTASLTDITFRYEKGEQ